MKTLHLLARGQASHARRASHSILAKRVLHAAVLTAAIIGVGNECRAQTISPRRLLEVVDFSPPVVSPDGGRVAFRVEQASVERNTYDTVWFVQRMDGSTAPRQVADGGVTLRDAAGVSLPAPATWSPDGRWIYYRALIEGKIDVWRAAADGSGAEPVTLDAGDVREFRLSEDGLSLNYSVGATREEVIEAEQGEYERGIRVDDRVPVGQNLFRSINIKGRWATQRYHGMWFGRASLLGDVPDRWKVIDLATRRMQDLPSSFRPARPPTGADVAQGLLQPWKLAIEPGTGQVALLTRLHAPDGFREGVDIQLAMLPSRASSTPVVCDLALCTGKAISGIQWRPGGEEVVFTVTDPHQGLGQSIFRWRVGEGTVHSLVASRGLISGGRDRFSACGLSAVALACVAAEADGPPRLERIDLETGHRHVLYEPNDALALDMAATAPARLLRWSDASGQAFTGQFFPARVEGSAPPPLFVTYYSCTGFLRGGVGDEWPLATLAEHGISALCINDPPGYILDAVHRFGRGLAGVRSVVDMLASAGEIDPDRVGMGGLSFGSEVTLWTAIRSDILAAASITSPLIEPNYYLFNTLRGTPFHEELKRSWGLGSPEATPERWRAISPVHNLDKIRAPVLFQMPEQEYLYSLGVSLPLIRDHLADLYVFPNEPHQKFQPKHKLAAYERNRDWFRFWLQDYENRNPVRTEEYMHWRRMRSLRSGVAEALQRDGF